VERAVEFFPWGIFTFTSFNKASEDTGSHCFYFAAICCYSHCSKLYSLFPSFRFSLSPSLLFSFASSVQGEVSKCWVPGGDA